MRTVILATFAMTAFALTASPTLAVDFPFHADHLLPGERIVTVDHNKGGGEQTGAKDLRVLRWVADNDWERLKQGLTDTPDHSPNAFNIVNSNYLIHGRPIYAMAGGTVVGCWRNAPENTPPNPLAEIAAGKILLAGNHIWIKQADGDIALYAHAMPNTIPASLCPHNAPYLTGTAVNNIPTPYEPEAVVTGGATVTAGQQLGSIGNSGNSSEPHLHVHMVDVNNKWQPMKFDRGQTTPFTNNTASLAGPWTALKGKALPSGPILIWPPHPIGNWTWNGISSADFQRLFDHFVDSGMMADTISCHNNGATYDTTWVPAKGMWVARAGMTIPEHDTWNTTYVGQGYKQTAVFTCGTRMAAVWRK